MTYNGYTNWDTWNAFNWASSEYWSYRWIMGLSVEELADYITDHAETWDGLDPQAVNVREVYEALHDEGEAAKC
ncbi:hypothetical protein QP904_04685 [Corynebacterium kefirresidentii]|uniref:hypothetical protein n=1 Tax=Corynebacterium sp. MSK185 TaxID=3377092 RepID=UPI00254F03FA|nr:hypothetical protein [Corynebacterium kefirresidentii]MDK8585768.1 hypothetical protein [Corynebacterium kefirresidentii]